MTEEERAEFERLKAENEQLRQSQKKRIVSQSKSEGCGISIWLRSVSCDALQRTMEKTSGVYNKYPNIY